MSKQVLSKLLIVATVFALSYTTASAQLFYPYPSHYEDFDQAVDLYNKEIYRSALEKLTAANASNTADRSLLQADIAFYTAMCALQVDQPNAESLLLTVLNASPRSHRFTEAAFGYGKNLYNKGDYKGASRWFLEVKETDLPEANRVEFLFKSGYSYYRSGDVALAVENFRKIKDQRNPYADAALYYYSHIEYEKGNHSTALSGFERLRSNPNYTSIIPYYTLQIAFIQKNYDKVIKEGEGFLAYSDDSRKDEITRLVAEAYFHKQDAANALKYFTAFEKSVTKLSRDDLFLKATIQYLNKDYAAAARSFDAAATINDSLSQRSHYYAGDSYIQSNNKSAALTSFMQASKMDFDGAVTENALLNYAKLALELNDDDKPVNNYLQKYPHGSTNSELVTYMAASAAKKGNFDGALSLLQSVKNPTPAEREAIQRIAFAAGQESMKSKNYRQAIQLFDLSKQYAEYPNSTKALALYWEAEATYQLGDFESANVQYENFVNTSGSFSNLREYKVAHYNIAYAYFKERRYDDALRWFRKYVSFENSSTRKSVYLGDSYNRIGDCYFKKRDFAQALENYNKAESLGLSNPDYSALQRAMSLGFTAGNDSKISSLQRIPKAYPKSPYIPAVYYELGRTYQQLSKHNEASAAFQTIISNHRTSPFYPKALVEMGLIELNKGNADKALSFYQQVVERSPGSSEAQNAMEGIKNIYIDQNRMDEYFAYANRVGQTVQSSAERDSLMFTAAEKQYQSGNCEQSLSAIKRYLADFPTGANLVAANFYLADCSMKKNDFATAVSGYGYVTKQAQNDFTEAAWSGYARANYNLKNYAKAADAFEQLLKMAQTPSSKVDAETGRMRSYAALKDFEKAAVPAARIAASKGIPDELIAEANVIRGHGLQQAGKCKEAIEVLRPLAKDLKKEVDAEAKYRVIACLYEEGNYKEVETEVYEFADSKSGQQYWMAKAFIVLGDVYVKNKDFNQARATYKSIMDGYKNKEDGVYEDARKRFEEVENK